MRKRKIVNENGKYDSGERKGNRRKSEKKELGRLWDRKIREMKKEDEKI